VTLLLQPTQSFPEIGPKLVEHRFCRRSLDIHDHVVVGIPAGLVRPEDLSESALYLVPDNCLPDFSRNRDSKTVIIEAVFEDVNHEVRTVSFPPPPVHFKILPALVQALLPRELLSFIHSPSTSSGLWRAVS